MSKYKTIAEVTKRFTSKDMVVENVPTREVDVPAEHDPTKNKFAIKYGNKWRVIWLLEVYMPARNIKVFDYKNEWTDELERQYRVCRGSNRLNGRRPEEC